MSASQAPRAARRQNRFRGISVGLIALLVAVVATIQIRSQAEVERSLVGIDPTSLAFLIDDLHRANDSLAAEKSELANQQSALQSGGSVAADEALNGEANRLQAVEGLVPVHGPGVVLVVDSSGLTALDLHDAINNFGVSGAEAIGVNDRRVVTGVPIEQTPNGVAIDGVVVVTPWTITVIGDPTRLSETADLMIQQLRTDRRVRLATYHVEADVTITAVVSQRPYVYAVET